MLDLYYGDEAGFSLQSAVPYGWQAPGEQLERLSQPGPRLNVLGWVSESGHEVRSHCFEGSMTSQRLMEVVDEWVKCLSRVTVLVLDNAPVHRSKRVQERLAVWQQAGLYVFFLPAYSPHLNKMETVWRKLKYEQLGESAYQSFAHLKEGVQNLLASYGSVWQVQFDPKHCIINSA